MKKLLAILLVLVMIFSLSACGNKYCTTPYDDYDLSQYVTLADYNSYEFEKPVIEVTDEEVEERVQTWLSSSLEEVEVTEGTVVDGDTIYISFQGVLEDGTTSDGLKSDSYKVVLGTTSMIDGFCESIIGKAIGEEYDVDLTFPNPYSGNTDLSGKGVTFTIKVLKKIEQVVPELTDAWVKKNTDYKNVEAYREAAKEEVRSEKEEEKVSNLKQEIYDKIISESEVSEIIAERVEAEAELCDRFLHSYATSLGYEWEEFLEGYYSVSTEDYEQQITTDSENIVQADMIVYAICQKEDIHVEQEDFDLLVDSLLQSAGDNVDAEQFEASTGLTPVEYIHYIGYDYMLFINAAIDQIYERIVK